MKIAIVDDVEQEQSHVEQLILEYSFQKRVAIECNTFSNGYDFLDAAKIKNYDMVFLDIFMDSLDGIKTAEFLRYTDVKCLLVFLTNSREHRAEAFSVHAFDYLEKPVAKEALGRVLGDALKLLIQKEPYIDLAIGKNTVSLLYRDFLYATADSNYLMICADKEYRCRMPFRSLASSLEHDSRFAVINRGILVNLDYVTGMEDYTCTMKDGASFPINRRKASVLKQEYIARQFARRTGRVSRGGGA